MLNCATSMNRIYDLLIVRSPATGRRTRRAAYFTEGLFPDTMSLFGLLADESAGAPTAGGWHGRGYVDACAGYRTPAARTGAKVSDDG
jgi:hypothetical protein